MVNNVTPTPYFIRRAKRLIKKFHTLEHTLLDLTRQLAVNPRIGDSYGNNIYKIRIADESKGKGKSGGFRVITYLVSEKEDGTDI